MRKWFDYSDAVTIDPRTLQEWVEEVRHAEGRATCNYIRSGDSMVIMVKTGPAPEDYQILDCQVRRVEILDSDDE